MRIEYKIIEMNILLYKKKKGLDVVNITCLPEKKIC